MDRIKRYGKLLPVITVDSETWDKMTKALQKGECESMAEWKKISPAGIYECSECGQNVMTCDIVAYRFCHGCGALMREYEEQITQNEDYDLGYDPFVGSFTDDC